MPRGMPTTMPAKISSDMPLPTPRSVICSPSHMMNAVPAVSVRTQSGRNSALGMVTMPKAEFLPLCVLTLTAGTAFIMWLGEQITERGVGNGMSLLIFAGIVVGIPRGIGDLYDKFKTGAWGGLTPIAILAIVVMMVVVVAFIIFVERAERRIPVQYAKRMVGRRM